MDTQPESAPPPTEPIDPAVEAIATRIGSGGTAAAIAALPPEHQETARRHPPRPIAERAAERSVATPEDWDELYVRLRAERAADWRASVPREFESACPGNLAPDQHPETIRDWWRSGRTNLVLRSPRPGNGKTYAAYAVANQVCERFWCVAYQVSELVRDQIDRTPDPRMWNRAVHCELLILDDLGQESGVSWEREKARDMLHRLMSARNGSGRRTIITTNRDGAWLIGAADPSTGERGGYGPAVLDRIGQDAVVIEFTGESRRETPGTPSRSDWGDL
jgi:hypothetical protein